MESERNYALITGGSSGIGFELAKCFARDGFNLVLVARDEQELWHAAHELQEYGANVITLSKDLSDPDGAYGVYEEVKAKGIIVEALVNDAGQGVYGKFVDTDLHEELAIIQLNIDACVILTKYFLKDMLEEGKGWILNLSSIAGKMPGPYQAVYHGTKAFIHFFSEAIRNELKDTHISVTSLLPGATDTDFFRKAGMESSKIVQEGELADPAIVAKDGYEALMAGKDMVVSGFKNKMQVAMGNITPDEMVTERMRKAQEPVTKSGKLLE